MTEFLRDHGVDLVHFVKEEMIRHLERKEVDRLFEILCKKKKNNALLLGDPGVGKTTLIEYLASRIYDDKIPNNFRWSGIYKLDVNKMVAGTQYRGQLEEKVQKLVQDLINDRHMILFLDDSQNAFVNSNSVSLMSLLKPYILDGKIACICVTNTEDFQKTFSKDKSLSKRFQKVVLSAMSDKEVYEVLSRNMLDLQKHHGVKYDKECLNKSIYLAKKFILDRKLPDSAIDILDEAGSIAATFKKYSHDKSQTTLEIQDLETKAKTYVRAEKYELLLDIKKEIGKLNTKLRQERVVNNEKNFVTVSVEDIEKVISRQNSSNSIKEKKPAKKLFDLKMDLEVNIYGQKNAISEVLSVLRRISYGLEGEKKPLASFLFCGPSGVGKTELAKIMTKHLYGSDNLVRLDMSEYSEKFTVSQLIGAPPGYAGYHDGGKLTEAVKRQPYSLILLDEVEKAHPDIYNLLLQVLDDGHITDANGQTVDFCNTVIVMTSNLGNNVPLEVGFKGVDDNLQKSAEKAISKFFRTEFLNRIDDIVYFESLAEEAFSEILSKEVINIQTKLSLRDIKIVLSEEVLEKVAKEGSSKKHGARFLKRTLYELVLDPMLLILEERSITSKKLVNVTLASDKIIFEI